MLMEPIGKSKGAWHETLVGAGIGLGVGSQLSLFWLGASQPAPRDFLMGALTGAVLVLLLSSAVAHLITSQKQRRRQYAIGFVVGFVGFVAALGVMFGVILLRHAL
jgi:multisubunit Na+/H+ antiporter MnhE subunit